MLLKHTSRHAGDEQFNGTSGNESRSLSLAHSASFPVYPSGLHCYSIFQLKYNIKFIQYVTYSTA